MIPAKGAPVRPSESVKTPPQLATWDDELDQLKPEVPAGQQSEVVRIGVIGYGYWGPNLVRNFSELPGSMVTSVCDARPERLSQVRSRYPWVRTATDSQAVIGDPQIDVVIVATPVGTHFSLAMASLQAGKHVLVEKPMVATSQQARQLIEEAEARQLVLMVDHTFVFTGAVQKIKQLVDGGTLGSIYYYDSVRVNLGLFQRDVDVLWDLAVHDLSIMDYVLGERPCAVAATGIAHLRGQPVNTAYLTCFFENNVLAHLHVNWLAPVKIRRTLIGGDARMIVYDDLEPSEKVKLYDRGITLNDGSQRDYELLVGYRSGDMWAPRVSLAEGLSVETRHFLDCVRDSRPPVTDGRAGLRVIRILEAATESLERRGQPVEIDWSND